MPDDEREIRDELERVQAENRSLRERIAELEAFDIEGLQASIAALQRQNAELKQRLEVADQVREDWDRRADGLRHELDTARGEQERLRKLLENARDEAWVKRMR